MSRAYPYLVFHPDRTERAWRAAAAQLPRTAEALEQAVTAWMTDVNQRIRRVEGRGPGRRGLDGVSPEDLEAALRLAALETTPADWPAELVCETLLRLVERYGEMSAEQVERWTAQWSDPQRVRLLDEALPPILWDPPIHPRSVTTASGRGARKAMEAQWDRIQTQQNAILRLKRDGMASRGERQASVSMREVVGILLQQIAPATRQQFAETRIKGLAPGEGWWDKPVTSTAPAPSTLRRRWSQEDDEEEEGEFSLGSPHRRIVALVTLLLDPTSERRASVLRTAMGTDFDFRRMVLGMGDVTPEVMAAVEELVARPGQGPQDLSMWMSLLTARSLYMPPQAPDAPGEADVSAGAGPTRPLAPSPSGRPGAGSEERRIPGRQDETAPDLRALQAILDAQLAARQASPQASDGAKNQRPSSFERAKTDERECQQWLQLVATPGLHRLSRLLRSPEDPTAAADWAAWVAVARRWQQDGGLPVFDAETMAFDLESAGELATWLETTGGWETLVTRQDLRPEDRRQILFHALDLELLSWAVPPTGAIATVWGQIVEADPIAGLDAISREWTDLQRAAAREDEDARAEESPPQPSHTPGATGGPPVAPQWLAPFLRSDRADVRERGIKLLGTLAGPAVQDKQGKKTRTGRTR